MRLYLGDRQSPISSPTQGPLVDSIRQLEFTDSRGQTSGYSIWASHIDPEEPVGILVHLHGDGAYEYKNDPDSWYLTSPSGLLATVQERNMILVIPFTPDREVDEINAETWWEDIVPHVGWAVELTQEILGTYSVDLGRVWFSGFSGGADAISHQVIPHHLADLGAHGGGFVILGGGGSPYQVTQTVLSSRLKPRFPITWVVGEFDRAEFAYDGYDGRAAAEEGEAAYRVYGWPTNTLIVPGKQHLLVEGSQGLYGLYIGQAIDAAPVISYNPGAVTELYLGNRMFEMFLGDQPVLTYGQDPNENPIQEGCSIMTNPIVEQLWDRIDTNIFEHGEEAKASAREATQAKNDAVTAAEAAAEDAGAADTSEKSAAGAASRASSSAAEALASKESAERDAGSAAESRSGAEEAESGAVTAAEDAAASSSSAATSAQAAAGDADRAETAANLVGSAAELEEWTSQAVGAAQTATSEADRAEGAATEAETTLASKADTDHEHTVEQITDLPEIRSAAAPDSLALRTSTGNILVAGTPSGPAAATSQGYVESYVDARVQEVTADQWPSNPEPGVIYWQAE